jgi:long-chain acyl-CoA synthetase
MSGNVADLLTAAAERRPQKTVLLQEDTGLDWTGLERRAGAVAAHLVAAGVVPGDRIAVALADPLSTIIALHGGLKAGATVAPLNTRLTQGERDTIFADLAPAAVVEELPEGEADFAAVDVADDASAIILYTSGTTGAPKGVLLSHGGTAFALESWNGPVMGLVPDDVVLSALPLAHSLGIFGSVMAPLMAGAAVVLVPRFTPRDCLDAIGRRRITVFPGVATMFRRILDAPGLAKADFSSLRYALSGAAPCPWELAQAWKRATGVRIIRGYGMSELFRPLSYSADDARDVPSAVGRPVPGVEIRIVDDDGNDLAQGATGELWILSPARLTGYLNQPDATAEVLEDGWFKTGDLATVSADGFVSIVGRKTDLILRGGYSVAAGEVESVLLSHPDIAEAAVIGTPHADLGEDIAAFVTLRPNAELAADDIIQFCKERLAGYKYPRHVEIRPELPKGPTGKVIKAQL